MKYIITIAIILGLLMLSLTSAYTAPSYTNVTITLDNAYTAPLYTNVTIVLGDEAGGGSTNCNPSSNVNWVITDAQVCNGNQISIGTGNITITNGNLTLMGGANVSANSIDIKASGDRVFISKGSELRL